MYSHDASRRLFLRHAGAMGALLGPAAAPLALNLAALGTASAQAAPDYKALVCLFLFGGNDAFNMVLPTDTASWANYSAVRNQAPDSIALLAPGTAANAGAAAGSPQRLGGVLPIAAHQCAGPQLRAAPGDGQPADDVRHRQAAGHPAEHRPAGHAHHQGAVRPELAPQAGQPVLAQRPAEHLAGAGARRAPRAAGAGAWATCWRR